MAYPYDDPYNPIPRRLREPTPGYSQTRLPGDERDLGAPVVDPRSPLAPSPARWGRVTTRRVDPPKVPEPSELDRLLADDNTRISWKDYASSPGEIRVPVDPGDGNVVSAYRVYSVGAADEIDAQIAAAKRRVADWEAAQKNPPEPRYVNMARDSRGGYAYTVTDTPPPADQSTPRPLFSGVAGEDFEATRRRGEQVAKLMRETDGPFANPNDWNYIRSYGPRAAAQAVASGRANISGAPPELVAQERERFLRNRTTDLSISPQLRSAARDELAQIERDAAEERRREMWAAEQAARLEGARIAAGVPVVGPGGVAAIPNAAGGWDVSRPEPAPAAAPAPVSFGGGAGAIPEIGEDGQPTGRYVYQAPPTPDPNAAPWVPGGGATSVNRVTGDVKTAPGSAPDPNDPKNWRKVGSDIVNVVTNERISGYDARKALDDQIARLRVARANNALLPDAVAQIDAQIAELEAQKQTLGVADAQAPEAPAASAEPAAQGGASSPSEPAPAPAPAAEEKPKKKAPKGYHYNAQGELEID